MIGVAEQTQIWKSAVETILKQKAPSNQLDIPECDEDLSINTHPSSSEYVWKAVSQENHQGLWCEYRYGEGGGETSVRPRVMSGVQQSIIFPVH